MPCAIRRATLARMHVTIIGRAAGEAPEWVRDAWIGLQLPLLIPGEREWRSIGVLTGPTGYFRGLWAILRGRTCRTRGYVIDAKAAVDILARANPEAAAWWRENAAQRLTGHTGFVFEKEVCLLGEG